MGHFNSLFLLLRVQNFNLLFLSLGNDVSFGFCFIPVIGLTGSPGYERLSAFVVDRSYWGMSYEPVEILGWAGFWDMVRFSFLFSALFFFLSVFSGD